jgi:hypothetical protein
MKTFIVYMYESEAHKKDLLADSFQRRILFSTKITKNGE